MLLPEERTALIGMLSVAGHVPDKLVSCMLCRALAGLEDDAKAGPVYSAVLDLEGDNNDGALVSFGGINAKYHYADGKPVEAHFIFNKALWSVLDLPDKLEVMFRRPAP